MPAQHYYDMLYISIQAKFNLATPYRNPYFNKSVTNLENQI